jgi:hypothetical protein
MPRMFAYNPMRLNIGSIAYCTAEQGAGLVSPDFVVFGCDENHVVPEFLKYLIEGPEWIRWTTAAGVGSVFVRIYYKELARMPLSLPLLCEKRAIVSILGALNDKIKLNRRMNETLDLLARAIFKSWFDDFNPVRAKMDGRQLASVDLATAALFPDELVHFVLARNVDVRQHAINNITESSGPQRVQVDCFDSHFIPDIGSVVRRWIRGEWFFASRVRFRKSLSLQTRPKRGGI